MEKLGATQERTTTDGLKISNSQVKRLERELKNLKEEYGSLKIKQLTYQGIESDPAKLKNDNSKLEVLKKEIKKKELQILEIKLDLK